MSLSCVRGGLIFYFKGGASMKKSWKKLLIASMACVVLLGVGEHNVFASYRLNSEVKDATPALKRAAEIGVRVSENAALQDLPNKDAILVMSFGTTFKDTRKANIEKTVEDIQAAHPDTKVVLAFTSHIIIDRIKENEGIIIPTPEQALEELKEEGYTRIALTNLNIIPGMEYAYNSAIYDLYKDQFKKMTLGTSLVYWMGQEHQRDDVTTTLKAVAAEFPKINKHEAVLLMVHGTPHPANAYYAVMQARLQEMGMENVLIYSVEGWPNLETIIPKLKTKGIKAVTLIPMMMVAGDHANNDMAGAEPESHKSILEKSGFKVSTYLHGLGENQEIRKLFVERANEAWNVLETESTPVVHHHKSK